MISLVILAVIAIQKFNIFSLLDMCQSKERTRTGMELSKLCPKQEKKKKKKKRDSSPLDPTS